MKKSFDTILKDIIDTAYQRRVSSLSFECSPRFVREASESKYMSIHQKGFVSLLIGGIEINCNLNYWLEGEEIFEIGRR